jgi:uncharacterized repeat protein (TIGR01451 family)
MVYTKNSHEFSGFSLAGLIAASLLPQLVQAAGTAAGSAINNTAQVSYDIGGSPVTTTSNPTTLNVAEIINTNLTTLTASVSVTPGATNQVLQFRLTNTGNGPEQFSLLPNSTIVGDDFDPTLAANRIYFDTDGTPGFSPGDTLYVPGSNDPTLAADASILVLVLNDIPTGLANGATGRSELSVSSLTGGLSGAVGQTYAGQGVGGVDAVLGTTAGRSQPVPGATITYQVVITASGTGTASNAGFTDAIPANTTYVPGTLRLNGATLTDGADADAGQYLGTPTAQVSVVLGTLTSASTAQTINFAVTIN